MTGRRRFGAVRRLSSGRWQARFRDPETNLYRNAPSTFETKTAAAKWLSAIETDIARDDWHDPKRGQVLFRSVAEQWYATKLHLRPSTQHIYRTLLDRHILPTFGDVPVGSITTLDVQMWISDRHRNTRMGANSVAKTYKLLRTVMESALDAGLIDLVVSDHSPCPPEMKCLDSGDFGAARGGIASLQLGLPVVWNGMRARGLPVERLATWMSAAPARLAGLSRRKGAIADGRDADFVVWRPEEEFTVTAGSLLQRHALTPYLGARLPGVVEATYLRGERIYERGAVGASARGVLLAREPSER